MKYRFALVIALIAILLVSCSHEMENSIPEPENGSWESVYVKSTGVKTISQGDVLDYGKWEPITGSSAFPWVVDAVSVSKADKTLRFYFMAGEGTQVTGVGEKIGDCCLVVFPNGTTMLIDACSSEGTPGYIPTLVTNLKRMGISKLDYVVITHMHSDHYQGFTVSGGVADSFEVGKVYINGDLYSNAVQNKCDAKGITYEILKQGDSLDIGDVHIDVLNPMESSVGVNNGTTTPVNNASITLKMTYKDIRALFTGDLYDSGMATVYTNYKETLDCDILKIPHHGHSETSINADFARAVSPVIAVASSSIALNCNVYEQYSKTGAEVIGDYNEGYVILSTDGDRIYTKTSRTKITNYYEKYDSITYFNNPVISVSTLSQLKSALEGCAANTTVKLDNDIVWDGDYTSSNPFEIRNLNKVTLDLNGHSITGITHGAFRLWGDNFTVKNGSLSGTGYILLVNNANTDSGVSYSTSILSRRTYRNVNLENLTITGGVRIQKTELQVRGCSFSQSGSTYNALYTQGCYVKVSTTTINHSGDSETLNRANCIYCSGSNYLEIGSGVVLTGAKQINVYNAANEVVYK